MSELVKFMQTLENWPPSDAIIALALIAVILALLVVHKLISKIKG